MNSTKSRLRAPLILVLVAAVPLAVGGATHGWTTLFAVLPVVPAAAAVLYLAARRDSDVGSVVRNQLDERQDSQRLRVQALVGRAASLAVAVAYFVAAATGAALWPYAVLLGVVVVSFLAGWAMYGEHDKRSAG